MKRPLNTHLFQRPARWGVLPLLALALTACGGGSEEPAIFQPGEVVTFTATLPDGSTQESHYLMHGVTADGDLLADDVSEKMSGGPRKRPPLAGVLVALPLEPGDSQQGNTPRLAALRDFYKQLWQGIAERRNDGSDIAAEIGAYETDVGALYSDYLHSGFYSVKDYVAFYEQVGENPYFDAQESMEEELVEFFYRTGWTQGNWVRALGRHHLRLTWPSFLNLMASRGDTFRRLLELWHDVSWRSQTPITMDEFIGRYVSGSKASPLYKAQADVAQSTGAEKFAVSKTSWGITIIDATSQASADILAREDINPGHYQGVSEHQNVCPTQLTVSGRLGMARVGLHWNMRYTSVKHPSLPGSWITAFGIDNIFPSSVYGHPLNDADGSFLDLALLRSLKAHLEIRDVKNVGTDAAPRPGFTARVKVTPSFIFNSPWVRDCKVG